jgi:hypothetical protein
MQKFRFYPVVTWFVLSVVSFGYAQEEVLILRRVAREFRPKGEAPEAGGCPDAVLTGAGS